MTAGGWGDLIGYIPSACPEDTSLNHLHPVWLSTSPAVTITAHIGIPRETPIRPCPACNPG